MPLTAGKADAQSRPASATWRGSAPRAGSDTCRRAAARSRRRNRHTPRPPAPRGRGTLRAVFDLQQRQPDARGRVRIGDHDACTSAACTRRNGLDVDAQAFIDRLQLAGNAIELGIDLVEAVAHVGHEQGLGLLEESEEGVREHFVRTVAGEHLVDRQAVPPRYRFAQRERGGIGVALQPVSQQLAESRRQQAATADTGSRWC
jgi:hypothetical protein